MRKDMYKVVVERPRRNRDAEDLVAKGRVRDLDDLPHHEGMKAGRRRGWNVKELNENLSPLVRYLESQVGRKWDDVYSDICQTINSNSTVQQHVRDHIFDFVEVKVVRAADGHLYRHDRRYFGKRPLDCAHGSYDRLYVEPETGILRRLPHCPSLHNGHDPFAPQEDYVPFGYERAYQRLNGLWFEVHYTLLPDSIIQHIRIPTAKGQPYYRNVIVHPPLPIGAYDVIGNRWRTPSLYPHKNRFAHAKRPLTTRELKAAGLVNNPDLLPPRTGRRGRRMR